MGGTRSKLPPCRLPRPVGSVCLVVTVMYWSGWEMGAVEAISLSILVGSSVDYCVHLVEGYLLAGENLPPHQAEVSTLPAPPLPSKSSPPSVPMRTPKGGWTPLVPNAQPGCIPGGSVSRAILHIQGTQVLKQLRPSIAVGGGRAHCPQPLSP